MGLGLGIMKGYLGVPCRRTRPKRLPSGVKSAWGSELKCDAGSRITLVGVPKANASENWNAEAFRSLNPEPET